MSARCCAALFCYYDAIAYLISHACHAADALLMYALAMPMPLIAAYAADGCRHFAADAADAAPC